MKKLATVIGFFLLIVMVQGQTTVFTEDFEYPSYGDSVVTDNGWFVEDSMYLGQHHYARCKTITLTSSALIAPFTPIPGDLCYLYFDQICKTDYLDQCRLDYYTNTTGTWIDITGLNYLGIGQFGPNGNRFSANSYGGLWMPSNAAASPSLQWWQTEVFDLTSLISQTDTLIKVRFREIDAGPLGGGNNYGWLIDNIRIVQSQNIVGIADISKVALNIYPNPSTGILSLSYEVDHLKIRNLSGQTLLELQQVDMVDLRSFAPGVYILDQCDGNQMKIILY